MQLEARLRLLSEAIREGKPIPLESTTARVVLLAAAEADRRKTWLKLHACVFVCSFVCSFAATAVLL